MFGESFIEILSLRVHDAQLPAIRTLGSISAGTDDQTEAVLSIGLLDVCPKLLLHPKVPVRKDVSGHSFWRVVGCLSSLRIPNPRSPLLFSVHCRPAGRCPTFALAMKTRLPGVRPEVGGFV